MYTSKTINLKLFSYVEWNEINMLQKKKKLKEKQTLPLF